MGDVRVHFDVALTAAIHKRKRWIAGTERGVRKSKRSHALGASVVGTAAVAIADCA
jgi:hypothetical protein